MERTIFEIPIFDVKGKKQFRDFMIAVFPNKIFKISEAVSEWKRKTIIKSTQNHHKIIIKSLRNHQARLG